MAVYKIEEKILGRLARQIAPSNALLSGSFYQVLGLSILLTRSLKKSRKRRRPDATTPDAKSIQLYHHIIWLAREGLSITEVYILPYCQDGEQGPECRVMAASLRASFYNVFCLYHNSPPLSQLNVRSPESGSPQSSVLSPKANNGQSRRSPAAPSRNEPDRNERGSKRAGKAPLRDPIPSMISDASYVTNPYAALPSQTPPPAGPPPPVPSATRRAPTRPPGLTPINIPEAQSSASFLLPPLNFVPLAREHFDNALHLANNLLPPANALRLTVAFNYAAFLWDCAKDPHRSRRVARRAIKDVYDSSDGLDDQEFVDAAFLVQLLGGAVRRGTNEPTPQPSREPVVPTGSATQRPNRGGPHIDRTIAVSPPQQQHQVNRMSSPGTMRSVTRTPERLSTVPEVDSVDEQTTAATTPPVSRLSSRSRQRRASSTSSNKEAKRKAAEQAEEAHRRRSSASSTRSQTGSTGAGGGGGSATHSRQATPQQDGTSTRPLLGLSPAATTARRVTPELLPSALPPPPPPRAASSGGDEPAVFRPFTRAEERRMAILQALDIISSVSRGLYVPERSNHRGGTRLV